MIVGWNFANRGFALCNGQLLPISQNTALFSLLGTMYGGNGQSNFQLPNLQGRVAIHQGQSAGTSLYTMGEVSGVESTTLLVNNMPMHTHQAINTPPTISPITATTTINGVTRPSARQTSCAGALLTGGIDTATNATVDIYATSGAGGTAALAPESATTTISGGAISAGTTTLTTAGGSLPFSILQPYVVVNYLIALEGIFPSRN